MQTIAPVLLNKLPLLLVGLMLALVITGCSNQVGIGIEKACEQWDYVTASRMDTQRTITEIYQNNVKREAFCDGL